MARKSKIDEGAEGEVEFEGIADNTLLDAIAEDAIVSENVIRAQVPSVRAVPIRELMSLTKAQRASLVREGMAKILSEDEAGLQGGTIPCLIKYNHNGVCVHSLLRVDSRLVSDAWEYYKENADMPTPEECIEYISEIREGPQRVFKRVIPLDWC